MHAIGSDMYWHEASSEPSHPLNALNGKRLGEYEAFVKLGPESRAAARYFQVLLRDRPDASSGRARSLLALFHQGPYPPHNWIEVMASSLTPDEESDLFRLFCALIPPGGHIMVEYDSPQRADSETLLKTGVPPLVTPLGHALFKAGFTAGFKDWYIPEGGLEGPRKLQAYKPLNAEHVRTKASQMSEELKAFLAHHSDALNDSLKTKAYKLLGELEGIT